MRDERARAGYGLFGAFPLITEKREEAPAVAASRDQALVWIDELARGLRVKNGLAWVLALLASTPALSADVQPKALVFAPAGPWAMEYADDSCRLVRNFRNGDDEVTLALERFGTGTPLVIGVAGSKARTWREAREVHVEFYPKSPDLIYSKFSSTLTDGRAYLSLVPGIAPKRTASGKEANETERKAASEAPTVAVPRGPEGELVHTEKIEGISLGKGFIEPLLVQTGSLRAPYEAMQKCLDDLLVSWKIDAAAHRSLKQEASPANFKALSKSFFYPLQAMAASQSGLVRYRLIVDPTGNVTDCKILGPGGTTPLGRETCRTMLGNAKFIPAQDAAGNPLKSFYVGHVKFVL